jgi:PAS domain S-box-containing protein
MKDQYKTKAQLIEELTELRKRIVKPEKGGKKREERASRSRDDDGDGETSLLNLEWALSLSEVIEALKRISSGDPSVRIDEASDDELIMALKHMVNLTAGDIGEIVELSHEFAMGLAEHFDVLHRVSKGDLDARVSGVSPIELLESLKKVTNEMIDSIEDKNRERDKTESMLRDMEALESSILSAIPHPVIGLRERRIIFANEAVKTVFGWKPRELIGRSTRILYRTDEEYEEIGRIFYPVLEQKRTFTHEFMCRHKKGRDIFCRVSASVIGEKLEDKGIVVMYEDITQSRNAEEALRESEQKIRYIVEHSNELFYIHGVNHKFTYISPQSLQVLGYSPDELKMEWTKLVTENPINEAGFEFTTRALVTGEKQRPYELEVYRKDGGRVFLEIDESPIRDKLGKVIGVVGAARDITELKKAGEEREKLHAQLLHAQKMEAIGQLAGGIAHDFNNILTAIIGYAHFLKMKTTGNDRLRKYAENILSLSERATNLTQGLLTLSRKQIINPRPLNINEIIKNVDGLLLRIIGEDIELKTVLTDRKVTVMADAGQIEQVLMNLATNARDAMPGGGQLTIETEVLELDGKFMKTHGFGKPGTYVLISESDTGEGMDDKTREKIFEPFYTTKEVGKGTGLGLSIVYGIVKQHEGYINVYSEEGRGTTFKIYLPLIKAEPEREKKEFISSPETGEETLLFAEDDDEVRAFTKEMLTEYGYVVIEASDGQDAINKFAEHKYKIQLLLLDVIMPKKNGKEVYEEIKKVKPDVKALFMSGYTADVIHRKGIVEEGLDFILKPVSPTVLLNKIRDMLGRDLV